MITARVIRTHHDSASLIAVLLVFTIIIITTTFTTISVHGWQQHGSSSSAYYYQGPPTICDDDLSTNHTRLSTWCQNSNPYSSQLQLLFPGALPASTMIPAGYWCDPSSDDEYGSSGQADVCQNIVAIRTYDLSEDARFVIIASRNNSIYYTTYSDGPPVFTEFEVPNSHSSKLTGLELASSWQFYVLQYNAAMKTHRFSFVHINYAFNSTLDVDWTIEFDDEVIQWKIIEVTPPYDDPVLAVLTRQKLRFYNVNGTETCSLTIKNPKGYALGFDFTYQIGHFDEWQKRNGTLYPMRIPVDNLNDSLLSSRLLIILYDSTQVRMLHYGNLANGVGNTCHNEIDMDDRMSRYSMTSLVWTVDGSSLDNILHIDREEQYPLSISTAKIYTSPLRRPKFKSDTDLVTCSNVEFAPSQEVYLSVALVHALNGTRENATIVTMHLEEFAMVDFSRYEKLCNDSLKPNPSEECVFNPAMRPSDYTFQNCEHCAMDEMMVDSEWVEAIDMKFIDASTTINGLRAYDNNNLNPYIICEASKSISDSLYMDCVGNVTQLYSNITLGKCDALIFNLDSDMLQPFFETFWQDNIFVLSRNFMSGKQQVVKTTSEDIEEILPIPQPSSIYVIGKTMNISPDTPFGDFKLTQINRMRSLGRVTDLHVTPNGQHLYATQLRYRYELQSLDRFKQICDILNNDPDSNEAAYLQQYKTYCMKFPPSANDIRQFGMLSSSCSDGVLCKRFIDYDVEPIVKAGHFVFNHISEVECPNGAYCSHGSLHLCPQGFQCNRTGLAAPLLCPVDGGDETCYLSPIEKMDCPFGAICPNAAQPPVLVPPGFALFKEIHKSKILSREIRSCKKGQYCPLALESEKEVDNSNEDYGYYSLWMERAASSRQLAHPLAAQPTSTSNISLECPGNMYCANSSVLFPSACMPYNNTKGQVVMPYCPPGSYIEELCPAGNFCPSPNDIRNCSKSEYCPPGSMVPDVCKEGYYCPDPTQQIKCPSGYFCRQGSTRPIHCSFLASCPSGSTKDSLTPFAVGVIAAILILILLAYCSFRFYNFMYARISRTKRLKDLAEEEKKKQEKQYRRKRYLTKKRSINNETSSLLQNPRESYYSSITESDVSEEEDEDDKSVTLLHPKFTADIQFEELGLTVRSTGKRVLYGVTGEIKHGELTCVMGLSGAGKSTFITTLAGRAHYGVAEGIIRVNGVERKLTTFNRRVGFVPQDDIMCRDCTVEETLYFAAKTRLDRRTTEKQITQIVNNVIRVLRLEDIRHSLIGDETNRGISGGQRKRVNVGIELVAQPVILFCDEPTSGLDSASSKEVCEVLQDIAKSGITVITVIHQPRFEIFEMFEQLLLLGKGGKTCYLGPVKDVKKYFEDMGFKFPDQVNVADYLMDITAGNALPVNVDQLFNPPYDPQQLQEKWKHLKEEDVSHSFVHVSDSMSKDQNEFTNPSLSYVRQFWMCFLRSITQQIRGIGGIMQDFFLVFICGLFLGLIFYNKGYVGPVEKVISEQCPKALRSICEMPLDDSVFKVASMMNLAMALTGIMASLKVFGKEKVVFARESQTGLSTFCFFWSKDIAVLPMNVLAPWIFLVMYYTLMDPRAELYEIYYVTFLTYWASYGLGFLISIVINNVNAQLFAVVFVFILNVFSGSTTTVREFKDMSPPFNILPYLSYLSFGLELSYLNEIRNYKQMYNIQKSLDLFGYSMSHLKWSWACLLGYGLVFRILAFIALWCSRPDSGILLIKNTISNWVLLRVKSCINSITKMEVSVKQYE